MFMTWVRWLFAIGMLGALFSAGCVGAAPVNMLGPTLEIASGSDQSGEVGTTLALPFVVIAKDADGNPVSGVAVVFEVQSGAGSISAASATTDALGQAETTLTLGATVGANTVSASALAIAGSHVTFTATGTESMAVMFSTHVKPIIDANCVSCHRADGPAQFTPLTSYALVRYAVSAVVATDLVVPGYPDASVLVQKVQPTGSMYAMLGPDTATRDANAKTIRDWIVTGARNTPVGPATQLALIYGDNQSATVSTALVVPLAVRVMDENDNPVGGVTVEFAVNAGGGTLSAPTATSDAMGRAEVYLSVGAVAGANSVTASSSGVGSPVTFASTGTAGTATQIALVSGNNQTNTVGTELQNPLVVVVKDTHGNPVSGFMVNFAAGIGGGSLSAETVVTNDLGQAQTALTLGTTAGTNTVSVNAAGLAGSGITFSATGTAAPAMQLVLASGNDQSAKAGSALSMPLVVAVQDAYGNPVAGKAVTFAVASGGGTLSATSATSNAMGQAQTMLTVGTTPGTNTVTASATGLLGALTFTATATTGLATTIALVSGNNQSATVGTQLLSPFVVGVADAYGNPVSGFMVTFAVASGAGSLFVESVMTNAAGQSQTTLTLGTMAGMNTVNASATGLTGSPVAFTATGTAGPATQIALVSGNNQTATVGTALSSPLVVAVRDAYGNPISGRAVSFAVTSGGGSVSATSVTTNAVGVAQSMFTVGPASGVNTATASAAGLTGSPITFTATGAAGTASQIAVVSGNNQSATAGTQLLSPFVVVAKDAGGNPVSGVLVSFSVVSGGGALSATSATTNAQGQAQTALTLGTAAGTNTVSASAAGLAGSPITFTGTGTAGAATQLVLSSGNNQSATVSSALVMPLVVSAKDVNGNPVSGVAVTFAVASGGGSLSATSATTSGTGQAQTTLTVGATAGTNTVTATVAGLTGSPVTFTASGTTGAATQIALVSGNAQTATVATALPSPFVVAVKDAGGNPVSGFMVTFAIASGAGTLSTQTIATNASGQAQTTLTLGATAGTNTVTANTTGLTGSPITFTATGTAGTASQLAIVSGNNQSAKVATALAMPFVVAVTDANGNPVGGRAVTFAVASGGGSVSATSATTNTMGQAQTTLTVGGTAGTNTVTVSAAGLTGSPITFTATATAGSASQIALVSGNNQTGTAGTAVSPFVVVVKDPSGNPVSGFAVAFTVSGGGGTLSAASATTNALGQAQTMLTLGKTAGTNTVTANATGLTGSPVTFTATGTAGAASQIALSSGNNQSAKVGTALAMPLVLVVTDVNGNAVAGRAITFAVATGGGSVSAASATTTTTGQAQTTLTLGPTAGANTVTATATGLTGSPVTFTATGTAATATQIALVSGNNQSAAVGTALTPFVVVVKDSTGNPVSGFSVTFTVTAGGGTLSAASATTNAQGQAQTTLTLGTTAGTNTVTANATGLTGSPVTFSASGTAGAATQIALLSGNNQSATVSTALAMPFIVAVKDANGNPASGVVITFAVASGGGILSATSATTNATGQAQATLTVGSTAGTNTVTASRAGLTGSPVTFTATGTAATATQLAIVSGNNQTAKVGTALASPFVVSLKDANGNAVPGAAVTFAVTSGGGTLSATSVTTNTSGLAQATLTLGATVGTNTVTASRTGLTSATFTATATSGTATQLALVSGNSQSGKVSTALASPFVVAVRDTNGNAVAGFSVTFSVAAGGGTLSAATVVTNAQGQAQTTLTLGAAAGTNTVTANATGLTGSPITFTATATAGTATQIAIVSGNNQTGRVGVALAMPLVVAVRDATGNPVSGVTIAFAVTGGGGSISATSAITNATGQAQTTMTVGAAPGTNTATATATGLTGSPITFTETARWMTYEDDVKPILVARCVACHMAGGTASFTPLATYSQVRFGIGFSSGAPLVVPNSPSASLLVTKTTQSTGSMYANLGPDPATRDANAKTINDWIAQGAFNTAIGPASQIVMTSGNNQSGSVNTTLTNAFVVTVMDANMNPVSGYNVTFAVTAGGGMLSAMSVATGMQGAAASTLKLGATAGTNTATASGAGLTNSPITFSATATAGTYSGAPLAGSTNPFDVAGLVAMKAANVEPVPLSSDGEFLRRVTADLAGRLPTLAEWTAFSASTDPLKREQTIDTLLASADFGRHWGLDILAAWLVVDKDDADVTTTDIANFEAYLVDAATTDKPLSTVIMELGQGLGTGGAAFDVLNMQSNARYEAADRLMETFTGIPSKCARCHDSKIVSPLDDPQWTQVQNKGLYRFFEDSPSGSLMFVVDGVATNPTTVPSQTATLAVRRQKFAEFLVASKAFPRGTGHRIFAEVMQPLLDSNRILAQPIADMKVPEVLKACSSVFTAQGTSLKGFLRVVMRSKLYQLTTKGTTTDNDAILARRTLRRHAAEVIQADIVGVTGIVDSTSARDDFLSKFGYAMDRTSITERSFASNTIQPLTLLNNPASVPGKVTITTGIIAGLATKVDGGTMTLDAAITEIFRRALTRDPTATELTNLKTELATVTTNKEKLEDVAVVVMNSTEFSTR